MLLIFRLFMEQLWPDLRPADLAVLARVSRDFNDLVNPYLYHTVRFHSPGTINVHDNLLLKLDTFGDPRFSKMGYIKRVIVSGTWYETYASIDSHLAPHKILSPAARMLSAILCSCVARMPNLEEFIWDMQVSMTQHLVSNLVLQPMLRALHLRMGTDCTPKPFFRPPLKMNLSVHLNALSLIQIDDIEVMKSVGSAISSATNLAHLSIWADDNSELSLSSLFESWPMQLPSQLHLLDLRGFAALGVTPTDFWATMRPAKLREVTLELGGRSPVTSFQDFWDAGLEAGLRPVHLTTNIADDTIETFLRSFSGLEVFHVSPSKIPGRTAASVSLLDALEKQHSTTLRVLGLNLLCHETRPCSCVAMLHLIAHSLPLLEELRIQQNKIDTQAIKAALTVPRLRVLYIDRGDDVLATTQFLSIAEYFLGDGYANQLKYIAFDGGPAHKYLRRARRFSNGVCLVGYLPDTTLLHEKNFDWVRIPY
ncbi:uncharacterized protein BO97DRAFT_471856 [Aspergillus homomorphus CBS 101889]|uniref:F-box domain-containing protein n=1 Tax=Aspergillus homomorphus (strain CBS 101889) TaxID=1450537 RepID=A0A395HRD7_ASPHC|nr:hypothetical protein BO97DRAFT_471856 [Aspergillus homomorphus CBS 101889]RAL10136.1 hypothetical protein BO97DRAFT_471856 [Aspergillus homomorphus CBS 101889]